MMYELAFGPAKMLFTRPWLGLELLHTIHKTLAGVGGTKFTQPGTSPGGSERWQNIYNSSASKPQCTWAPACLLFLA